MQCRRSEASTGATCRSRERPRSTHWQHQCLQRRQHLPAPSSFRPCRRRRCFGRFRRLFRKLGRSLWAEAGAAITVTHQQHHCLRHSPAPASASFFFDATGALGRVSFFHLHRLVGGVAVITSTLAAAPPPPPAPSPPSRLPPLQPPRPPSCYRATHRRSACYASSSPGGRSFSPS